jgi:RNA polymerase sigma-70 factor (ECF subfamily)
MRSTARSEEPAAPGGAGVGSAPGATNVIRPQAFQHETGLVEAAQRGDRGAMTALVERHATHVTRLLARILGPDKELADHAQDVLHMAVRDLHTLRDPAAFGPWLSTLTVYAARGIIKKRQRFRWFFRSAEPSDPEPASADPTAGRAALRAVYHVLDKMTVEERTVFALRFLEGMELTEVAAACDVSLATVKRRLRTAEDAFGAAARELPALAPWLKGSRWEAP